MLKKTDFIDLSPADRCRRVADYIESSRNYDQHRWDTCAAGIACQLAGYKVAMSGRVTDNHNEYVGFTPQVAGSLLHLSSLQQLELFSSSSINVPDQLRRHADANG